MVVQKGKNFSCKWRIYNLSEGSLDTTETENHIVLEDETVRGDSYTGNKLVQESGTGTGDIADIRIVKPGSNYTTLPTITVTSSSGNNASILAHGDEIGRALSLKVLESGSEYHQSPTPPTLSMGYAILKDVSGSIVGDLTATSLDSSSSSITATTVSFNSTLQILKFTSGFRYFSSR